MTPEQLAQAFHESYERQAPTFGYETRKASAKPWSEVPKVNRDLMVAVCRDVMPLASLFQLGDFTLHSGSKSRWKIECDALTDMDLGALAQMLAERLPQFGEVVGIPRGGLPIADALCKHKTVGPLLVVDDVVTTGNSFLDFFQKHGFDHPSTWPKLLPPKILCAAIFARGTCPDYIFPLFRLSELKWTPTS